MSMPLPVGVWMLVVVAVRLWMQPCILMPSAALLVDFNRVKFQPLPRFWLVRSSAAPPVASTMLLAEEIVMPPAALATMPLPLKVVTLTAPVNVVVAPPPEMVMPSPVPDVLLTVVVPVTLNVPLVGLVSRTPMPLPEDERLSNCTLIAPAV